MNLLPYISKRLGLENGEEFSIHGGTKVYRFYNGDLQQKIGDDAWAPCHNALLSVLTGKVGIIKLPFAPKINESYFTYDVNWNVICHKWFGTFDEHLKQNAGCIFKTKEDAVAAKAGKYLELTGKVLNEKYKEE